GLVQLRVESQGFAAYDAALTLRRGNTNRTVTLRIAGLEEQVVVTDTATDDRRGNSLTTTLEQDDIDQLSDDPDELQEQLEQMTGGAGAVFQVDGFRGGRLPPRDQIRQIRFRLNSFSADNHDAGRVRVEIVTRPGLTAWNGNANFGLRSDVLNARNAFSQTQTPEQFRRFTTGMRGPLIRNRTSLRLNVDGNRSFDSATIVAQTPDAYITGLVRRPVEATNVTVGLEHGLTRNQTLRFEYRRSEGENRNLGVGDFNLAERAFTRTRGEHQVRTTVQSLIGKSLNEVRLQFNRVESGTQSATTAPSIIVIDAFGVGGAGVSNETMNRTWDVSDDFDFTVGKHAMRVGVRLEAGAYQQFDARNANGTFTFGSLESYLAGLPTTYTQRVGQVRTAFSQYQLGVYWQDDFRVNRNLSLSVGVREEVQSHVNGSLNLMPRFGYTWNPFGWKTTLRGGYGMFYDWYDSNLYDQTLRVDGVAQRDLLVLNPGYPDPFAGAVGTVLSGGRVQADPHLEMPYVHQASIGAERALTPTFTVQASLAVQRGHNQLRARNVNAPDAFGVRPQPGVGTITQIESTGKSVLDRLTLGFNYRFPKYRVFIGSNYTLASAKNHSDNALSLPANSLNPDLDWGPANQDVRHRFNTMLNIPLPLAIRASINANASSSAPYTITTGRDDNGDGVTNDRPAGVGRNSARGESRFELSVRVARGFGFGDVPGTTANQAAGAGPGGAAPAPPPGGEQVVIQAPPGGGPGPGGPGGGGGFFGFAGGQANRRFNVEFYVQAFNLLNQTNFQNFSGNLLSPFFGYATSASQARRVEVGMQFRF
ncbi:MAG: hypothetical protein ABL993_05285, partial [Vicinamibacterales bacterium]